MRWILSRLTGMWLVVHSPREAFARSDSGPAFLVPLVVLSLFYSVLSIIQAPIQVEWMQAQINAAGAPPDQAMASLELFRRSVRWALASVPLLLLLRWLAYALLLWLGAQALLIPLGFSTTVTVVAYAYVPVLLRDATSCLVLLLRDDSALVNEVGLNVALGLNLVFPRLPLPWWVLAGNINPFEVWFVSLLAAGLAVLGQVRWRKSLAVVLPVWLFVALVQFGFVTLGCQFRNHLARG